MKQKAISLLQPWASLWVAGIKTNETRGRRTSYRGPLLVHAALFRSGEGVILWEELWNQIPELLTDAKLPVDFLALPFGAIVGNVQLSDCLPAELVHSQVDWLEKTVGNYDAGRFIWCAEAGTVFSNPIPCKGRQGFWNFEVGSAPLPDPLR